MVVFKHVPSGATDWRSILHRPNQDHAKSSFERQSGFNLESTILAYFWFVWHQQLPDFGSYVGGQIASQQAH